MINIWKDGLRGKEMETTHEMLQMGEKNSHNRKQLWEDGNKLAPWILKRIEPDWEKKNLLRSSNAGNDDEKHHQIVEISGIKIGKVEPNDEKNCERSRRRHLTDDKSFLRQTSKRNFLE